MAALAEQNKPSPLASAPSVWMQAAGLLLLLAALTAAFLARSWPLVHDAPLIHYVIFLMDHGRAPYRDIIEMNMPGTYLIEGAVMHTLGGGARAWWLWDCLLSLAAVAASAWIAGPTRRFTGVAAGSFAWLVHLSDGPMNLGQRDWTVAVLLLLGFGFLFTAVRRTQPVWMAGFLFCVGTAASIKPPILAIAAAYMLLACWRMGRPHWLPILGWSLLGLSVPVAASVAFLLRWHVVPEFAAMLRGLLPLYAAMGRLDLPDMILRIQPWRLRVLTLAAVALFLLSRGWRRWPELWLLGGALSGIALYLLQRKGWSYHLYTEVAFFALWLLLLIDHSLQPTPRPGTNSRLTRPLAAATLALVLLVVPVLLHSERSNVYPAETVTALQADLERLGGPTLSGHVQCLDMTRGSCIDALYRERLLQTTGAIYDFYLFPKDPGPVTAAAQSQVLAQLQATPPTLIVLSSHTWVDDTYSYDQIARWPALQSFLAAHYRLGREFPKPPHSAGYRLYQLIQP